MTWQSRTSKIGIGDRVAFKASFCRNTGQTTGDLPLARGEVIDILTPDQPFARAVIKWDNLEGNERVLLSNLSKITQRGLADE